MNGPRTHSFAQRTSLSNNGGRRCSHRQGQRSTYLGYRMYLFDKGEGACVCVCASSSAPVTVHTTGPFCVPSVVSPHRYPGFGPCLGSGRSISWRRTRFTAWRALYPARFVVYLCFSCQRDPRFCRWLIQAEEGSKYTTRTLLLLL